MKELWITSALMGLAVAVVGGERIASRSPITGIITPVSL